MSIHGFMDQNGQIQKYDYNDLENKPTIPAEVLIDDTLTEEGQAADAKAVGDAISNIEPGLSSAAKQALLEIFQHVAYIDEHGQDYYDALEASLFPGSVYTITNTLSNCMTTNTATAIMDGDAYATTIIPSSGYTLDGASVTITMGGATVTGHYNNGQISIPNVTGNLVITVLASSAVSSISAVFTQGANAIYDTDSLNTLRQYLVVTATYSNSQTAVVTDYTLSGTLTVGTSTITASYGGKTSTFTVTVTSGFLYTSANGLLSEQPYITLYGSASTSLDPFTETLTSDGTRIQCPKQSSVNGRAIYKFDPNILSGDGKMIVEFKIADIGWFSSNNTSGDGVFGMEIADSSNGSDVGICRVGSNSATPKFRTRTAATVTSRIDVSLNAWHTIEIRYENGKQTTILDGTSVLTNADPSNATSLWGAYSYITFTQSNTNALDFYIRKVEFAAY